MAKKSKAKINVSTKKSKGSNKGVELSAKATEPKDNQFYVPKAKMSVHIRKT